MKNPKHRDRLLRKMQRARAKDNWRLWKKLLAELKELNNAD